VSQESIDLGVAAFEAWNRGDYEAWVHAFDSNCVFWPLRARLEGNPYRGHAELREFMRDLTAEWEGVRFSVEETGDRDDFVVARVRFRGRGRASGAEINVPISVVAIVRASSRFACTQIRRRPSRSPGYSRSPGLTLWTAMKGGPPC
jgi:ketosteroid isomerase-like protein